MRAGWRLEPPRGSGLCRSAGVTAGLASLAACSTGRASGWEGAAGKGGPGRLESRPHTSSLPHMGGVPHTSILPHKEAAPRRWPGLVSWSCAWVRARGKGPVPPDSLGCSSEDVCRARRCRVSGGDKKSKWFQVTHFPACPPASALGLGVASSGIGRLVRRSPQRVLARCVSSLRTSPADSAGRDRHLVTAFRSPTAAVLSENLRSGINVPGLPLQCPDCLSRSPFGLWTPPPVQGVPSLNGRDHCPRPVATFQTTSRETFPGFRSPFGLSPVRLTALGPVPFRGAYFSGRPDPPSLPARAVLNFASGSSFRGRYLPGSPLFREPLGTISIMSRKRFSVKRNQRKRQGFATIFSPFLSNGYKDFLVETLCKKQRLGVLFYRPDSRRIIPVSVAIQACSSSTTASTASPATAR